MNENTETVDQSTEEKTGTVTEQTSKEMTLEERLSKATEQKSFTRPEHNRENKSAVVESSTDYGFLGSDDDFDQVDDEPEVKQESRAEDDRENEPVKPKAKSTSGITDKAKRSSARTAVGMIDLLQKGIFTPLHNWKFGKKFSKEQKEKLLEIEDAELNDLTDKEDRLLKARFDRLMKKHAKKVAAIPFNDTERSDMEEAFFQYFDFKEKTLPPEWFVAMAVVKSLGDRTVDLITD